MAAKGEKWYDVINQVNANEFIESPEWAGRMISIEDDESDQGTLGSVPLTSAHSIESGGALEGKPRHEMAVVRPHLRPPRMKVSLEAETNVEFLLWRGEHLIEYLLQNPSVKSAFMLIVGCDVSKKLFRSQTFSLFTVNSANEIVIDKSGNAVSSPSMQSMQVLSGLPCVHVDVDMGDVELTMTNAAPDSHHETFSIASEKKEDKGENVMVGINTEVQSSSIPNGRALGLPTCVCCTPIPNYTLLLAGYRKRGRGKHGASTVLAPGRFMHSSRFPTPLPSLWIRVKDKFAHACANDHDQDNSPLLQSPSMLAIHIPSLTFSVLERPCYSPLPQPAASMPLSPLSPPADSDGLLHRPLRSSDKTTTALVAFFTDLFASKAASVGLSISPQALEHMVKLGKVKTLRQVGSFLTEEGEELHDLAFLVSGSVAVSMKSVSPPVLSAAANYQLQEKHCGGPPTIPLLSSAAHTSKNIVSIIEKGRWVNSMEFIESVSTGSSPISLRSIQAVVPCLLYVWEMAAISSILSNQGMTSLSSPAPSSVTSFNFNVVDSVSAPLSPRIALAHSGNRWVESPVSPRKPNANAFVDLRSVEKKDESTRPLQTEASPADLSQEDKHALSFVLLMSMATSLGDELYGVSLSSSSASDLLKIPAQIGDHD